MKMIFIISALFVSSIAFAQSHSKLGAEIGGLYLTQSGGGNTTTVLPMLNYKFLKAEKFKLNIQAGATVYLDHSSDDKFFVGVARVNPIYQIAEKFSLEGLLGTQFWAEGSKFNLDLGGRVNYSLSDMTKNYLDDVFAGGGVITHEEAVTYFTLGVKKWF